MHELVHPKGAGPRGSIDIGRSSDWGNHYPLVDPRDDEERRLKVLAYADWLRDRPLLCDRVRRELRGRHLECPGRCAPRLCHGDVLARVAAGATYEEVVSDLA